MVRLFSESLYGICISITGLTQLFLSYSGWNVINRRNGILLLDTISSRRFPRRRSLSRLSMEKSILQAQAQHRYLLKSIHLHERRQCRIALRECQWSAATQCLLTRKLVRIQSSCTVTGRVKEMGKWGVLQELRYGGEITIKGLWDQLFHPISLCGTQIWSTSTPHRDISILNYAFRLCGILAAERLYVLLWNQEYLRTMSREQTNNRAELFVRTTPIRR